MCHGIHRSSVVVYCAARLRQPTNQLQHIAPSTAAFSAYARVYTRTLSIRSEDHMSLLTVTLLLEFFTVVSR